MSNFIPDLLLFKEWNLILVDMHFVACDELQENLSGFPPLWWNCDLISCRWSVSRDLVVQFLAFIVNSQSTPDCSVRRKERKIDVNAEVNAFTKNYLTSKCKEMRNYSDKGIGENFPCISLNNFKFLREKIYSNPGISTFYFVLSSWKNLIWAYLFLSLLQSQRIGI